MDNKIEEDKKIQSLGNAVRNGIRDNDGNLYLYDEAKGYWVNKEKGLCIKVKN